MGAIGIVSMCTVDGPGKIMVGGPGTKDRGVEGLENMEMWRRGCKKILSEGIEVKV